MANANLNSFFETLVTAASDANKALVAPNYLVDVVYRDFKPEPIRPYGTLSIPIPNSSYTVSDIGSGAPSVQDVSLNPITLSFNAHPALMFKLSDFDLTRSAGDMRALFLDEAVKRSIEYLNGQIAGLITAGNFSQVITGTTPGTVPIEDVTAGYMKLAKAKVNVRDTENMFMAVSADVYGNILTDPSWVQYNNIGQDAGAIRRSARFNPQFGITLDYDLDIPASGAGFTNFLCHRYAIALGLRPMMNVDEPGARSITIYVKGIPFRVTLSFSHANLGYLVSIDFGYALGVVRADHGVRIVSA